MPWVRFNLKKFCGEEVPESELAKYLHTDFDDNVIDKITVAPNRPASVMIKDINDSASV